MAESIRWTRKNAPQLRTIFVRSDIFSNGGANAVQEVAYTFAIAVEYIREMQKRGIDIHDIAQSLQFAFNTGATFYIEIAKLRAARQVWSNIMKAFGAEEKRPFLQNPCPSGDVYQDDFRYRCKYAS